MVVYKIDTNKSKIHLSGQVGKERIEGYMNAAGGELISELGQLIEGNIRFDLSSLSIQETSLNADEKKNLVELLTSLKLLNGDDTKANYSIEAVQSQEHDKKVRGLLNIGKYAYGANMDTVIDQMNQDLHAHGKIKMSKSNLTFMEDFDRALKEKAEIDKPANKIVIDCDLYASSSKSAIES